MPRNYAIGQMAVSGIVQPQKQGISGRMVGKPESEIGLVASFRVARHPPTIGALVVAVLGGAHDFKRVDNRLTGFSLSATTESI